MSFDPRSPIGGPYHLAIASESGNRPLSIVDATSESTIRKAYMHDRGVDEHEGGGSGGIGCELLKNLALSGFRNVEVIDLDTIDVSNLNRQFLFRSAHVGMPKCVVASDAALRMVPPLLMMEEEEGVEDEVLGGRDGGVNTPKYIPHHGNVCDNTKFNVPFLKTFALVLNALDNVAARRRVNRLCLAASVPLVEAGTAGYLGQVTVIDRASNTECYECQAKPAQKVYPICTIRSTPSQPVHCIVWAKELYKLCFAPKLEDSMLFEDEESLRADVEASLKEKEEEEAAVGEGGGGERNANGGGEEKVGTTTAGGEKSTYMDAVNELRALLGIQSQAAAVQVASDSDQQQPSLQCNNNDDNDTLLRTKAQQALAALFITEIQKQIGMDRYKTADKVPVPISPQDIARCTDTTTIPPTARESRDNKLVWSPGECVSELASCFVEVAAQTHTSPDNGGTQQQPLPEFDKDDDVAMRFVTAASNLRSYVFSIGPLQSLYDAKGIAGNIIPAIATTNAIVAGLQVLQSFHILRAQMEAADRKMEKVGSVSKDGGEEEEEEGKLREMCRYIYCLRDKTRKGYYLQPTTLPEPNPNCFVCRNATISLSLNTEEWTLGMLLERVIKKELGFAEPTIMVGDDSIVYEEGDDIDTAEYSANLSKKLADLPAGGLTHGSSMQVEDFTQNLEVEVNVSHRDCWTIEDKDEYGKVRGEPKQDDREEIEKFEIGGKKPISTASAAPVAENGGDGTAAEAQSANEDSDDDDDMEVFLADDAPKYDEDATKEFANNDGIGSSQPPLKKRRVGEDISSGNGNGSTKETKLDDDVIELE
mmetsp:Transcript_31670/g.76663  ORF Transcript_31670/g.76663 Transcript_31670/m.76663 type:complete len:820 (+) Transcript_31670:195-2654(+)